MDELQPHPAEEGGDKRADTLLENPTTQGTNIPQGPIWQMRRRKSNATESAAQLSGPQACNTILQLTTHIPRENYCL